MLSNATQSNAESVEVAVQTNVALVREHRRDIGDSRAIVRTMLSERTEACEQREEIKAEIVEVTKGDRNGKRHDAMMRAIALPSRSSAMVNLAGALRTLVGLERQAFNLDAPDAPANANTTFNQVRLDMTPQEAMEAYMAMLREPPLIEG